MPVGPFGSVQMMSHTGTHSSRSERAADIDVESRPKPQLAESSDADFGTTGTRQQEGVGAGGSLQMRDPLHHYQLNWERHKNERDNRHTWAAL